MDYFLPMKVLNHYCSLAELLLCNDIFEQRFFRSKNLLQHFFIAISTDINLSRVRLESSYWEYFQHNWITGNWSTDRQMLNILYIRTIPSYFIETWMFYSAVENHLLKKHKMFLLLSSYLISSLTAEFGAVLLFIRRYTLIGRFLSALEADAMF